MTVPCLPGERYVIVIWCNVSHFTTIIRRTVKNMDQKQENLSAGFAELPDKELCFHHDAPLNYLIEGDNLTALRLLRETHAGKVDVIYIDPPYNTGSSGFLYEDSFTASGRSGRHAKWLAFMEPRLFAAKDLMAETGAIFISIDDHEQAHLRLLCDTVFGEDNFMAQLPRVTKKSGKDHSGAVAGNHDYILIYAKNREKALFRGIPAEDSRYPLKDDYYDLRGGYKLNQTLDYNSLWYNPAMDFPIEVNGETFYPGGSEELHRQRHAGVHKAKDWVWRWSMEKFRFGLENGFVVVKDGIGRKRIYTKTYSNASISGKRPYQIEYRKRETKLSSLALTGSRFSNDNAKKEITRLGFEEFGFPKPVSLIKQLIGICGKQDLVLDFFAGSGTTGHAVLEMNAEDGGRRSFILCTNNENGICENVTWPRIKTVMTGIKKDGSRYSDGIPASLKYLCIQ